MNSSSSSSSSRGAGTTPTPTPESTSESTGVYVGLDYHSQFVQVCVLNQEGEPLKQVRVRNDLEAIVVAVGVNQPVIRTAIEASTGAADLAEALVREAGWSVDLAHAGYVHRLKGSPDKTDFSDARLLADLTRVGYLPKVWLAPEFIRELRRLIRFRQQRANERRAVKLRIRGLLRDHRIVPPAETGRAWTIPWLLWLAHEAPLIRQSRWVMDQYLRQLNQLKDDLLEIERYLKQTTDDDPLVQHLLEEAGVGPITAWTIRAEVGRFDRFTTGKQLSRFCGLSPRNASSGQRQADAGLIRAGNPALRATLIEAAWRLIRYEPRWQDFANNLLRRGKPRSVIAAAVANRWIRGLYHRMKPLGLAA